MPSDHINQEEFEKLQSEINSLNMGNLSMGDEVRESKLRQELIEYHRLHRIDRIDDRKVLKLGRTDRIEKFVPNYNELKHSFNLTALLETHVASPALAPLSALGAHSL